MADTTQTQTEASRLQGLVAFTSGAGRLVNSALSRIAIFLFVGMPIVFISLMYMGGLTMSYAADWPFERGFNFMASAITGGAIVFPAEHPQFFLGKVFASVAASFGVGIFAFTVSVLGNSVVAPMHDLLGLGELAGGKEPSTRKIFGTLNFLAIGIMLANLVGAIIFGGVLSYFQGWDFGRGFCTMASVELGGGIQFQNMGTVTKDGRLLYLVVGVWSTGMTSLMVAIAGDPGSKIVGRAIGVRLEPPGEPSLGHKHRDPPTARDALHLLGILVFIVLPVTLLLLMLAVATIMAPLTTWTFKGTFWAALPAVSGGATALTTSGNPLLTWSGSMILICAASAGFFILSIMIGVGGNMLDPIVEGPVLGPYLGKPRTIGHSFVALVGISGVMIPVLVFFGSLFVGGMMALVQHWSFWEGFWWSVSVTLGGGMVLSDGQVDSFVGMLFGTIAAAWSIGISILAIGLSGAPVVVPLMDALGMTLQPEELKSLAAAAAAVSEAGNKVRKALSPRLPPCISPRRPNDSAA